MLYEEIPPSPPLAAFIKCFWMLESPPAEQPARERILPDGCMEIVFNLADPFTQFEDDGTGSCQPRTLLVGQMRRYLMIEPTGRVSIIGIRFKPGGAYPFLGMPQDEIAGKVFNLDAVLGSRTEELESKLRESRSAQEMARHIEAMLLERLRRFKGEADGVTAPVESILRFGGCVSIEDLARSMGISLRQLDRRFNTRVGLPPKALCRIVRLQRALRMIERGTPSLDWVRLALDCGYYDQPHFIKDFKEFSGKEPTSFLSEANAMSDHFTQSS
jgi:AraC-like DNA-binding protein